MIKLFLLLLIPMVLEFILFSLTEVSTIQRLRMRRITKKWIKENLPKTWKYKIGFISTTRYEIAITSGRKSNLFNIEYINYLQIVKNKVTNGDLFIEHMRQYDRDFDPISTKRDNIIDELLS